MTKRLLVTYGVMGVLELTLLAVSCVLHAPPATACIEQHQTPHTPLPTVLAAQQVGPHFSGDSVDVVLTAEAAYAWDVSSGASLYEKHSDTRRPVASITKLLSAVTAVDLLPPEALTVVSSTAARHARLGANVKLPAGHEVTVGQLLSASLIASANDAMVALAEAVKGSEPAFVDAMNQRAQQLGLVNTVASNATGLSGGEQFSTARDVSRLMTLAYKHPLLRPLLAAPNGTLRTEQGVTRHYESTNKLLKTYVPVQAAKTGYTVEAGQNLVIISEGAQGQLIGAVILGSEQRFQDMKVLLEWVGRNYSWN